MKDRLTDKVKQLEVVLVFERCQEELFLTRIARVEECMIDKRFIDKRNSEIVLGECLRVS